MHSYGEGCLWLAARNIKQNQDLCQLRGCLHTQDTNMPCKQLHLLRKHQEHSVAPLPSARPHKPLPALSF